MQSTEDERREEGTRRMKVAAAGALARVRGVMGALPWGPSPSSTTRRRGHGHGHGYDGPGPGPGPPRPGEELQLELVLQGQGQEQRQQQQQQEEKRHEEDRPRGPWTSVKTAVDRHELISFLDDADADDFCPSRSFAVAATNVVDTPTNTTTTATSSIFLIDRDGDEVEERHAEDDRDRDGLAHFTANSNITNTNTNKKNIDANTATTTPLPPLARKSSFYSSARSSFESTNLTALSAATTAATTTTTTTTMAPLTAAPDAKDNGRATTAAPATTRTTSFGDDSSSSALAVDDWSRDLWDYLHHGLDGQSSPDLRLLLQNDYPSLLSSREQEERDEDGSSGSMHRRHQRDGGYHHHLQQEQQQQSQKFEPSSSSTYHQVLNEIRPESSRSFQNRLNNNSNNNRHGRNNSEHQYSHFRAASTESAGGATATWTLRSGRSHEKSNSGSSKTTTATAMTIPTIVSSGSGGGARESKATALTNMTGMTASTTATTSTNATTASTKMTTLSAPSSTMLAAGALPPVSPSTASFGAEMTKQEFEALPEAIQRKSRSTGLMAPSELSAQAHDTQTNFHGSLRKQRKVVVLGSSRNWEHGSESTARPLLQSAAEPLLEMRNSFLLPEFRLRSCSGRYHHPMLLTPPSVAPNTTPTRHRRPTDQPTTADFFTSLQPLQPPQAVRVPHTPLLMQQPSHRHLVRAPAAASQREKLASSGTGNTRPLHAPGTAKRPLTLRSAAEEQRDGRGRCSRMRR
ncbi:hypothetical protein CSOJ01_04503 [Colletotrichum sojae]|uniref:Uncharacterized protein n=1 Tax=Colletotrichum sojae TaxID=2175907 RepID=A0A8H6MYD5_9PEZI|nr:hypothetical protein CSOJ01_04503 [Colletotrichum sojae]